MLRASPGTPSHRFWVLESLGRVVSERFSERFYEALKVLRILASEVAWGGLGFPYAKARVALKTRSAGYPAGFDHRLGTARSNPNGTKHKTVYVCVCVCVKWLSFWFPFKPT